MASEASCSSYTTAVEGGNMRDEKLLTRKESEQTPIHPPPHPFAPPPLAPDHHHHTVIIIMFVLSGGLLFFAFLAAALFCCLKKLKKKTFKEAKIIRFDEHRQVKEEIIEGPGVKEAIILTLEDDVHIEEEIMKAKRFQKVGEGSHRNNFDTTTSTEASSIAMEGWL